MENKNKTGLATIWAIVVILVSAFIAISLLTKSATILPIGIGASLLLFGPITAVLYLIEVKRGVFNVDAKEE
jgi:hypothetical protein